MALLLGIPGPQNARGRILYDLVEGAEPLTEVTILDISDYHGQLIPLSEAADTVGPTFGIGGSAFLKQWFATYEAEAALSGDDKKPNVIEMAAGDSVGATPPISAFFGDVPTIEVMNMMGIDVDGLGNHNFDRGQDYLRHTLIPLADYPFVSANIVDAAGNTPAEWSPSPVLSPSCCATSPVPPNDGSRSPGAAIAGPAARAHNAASAMRMRRIRGMFQPNPRLRLGASGACACGASRAVCGARACASRRDARRAWRRRPPPPTSVDAAARGPSRLSDP